MSRRFCPRFLLPLAVACGPQDPGSTLEVPAAGDPDSGAPPSPRDPAEVSILATATTPLLGGWREGDGVWLVGGSTLRSVQASGLWRGTEGCLDLTPGAALWWVDGQPDGPVVAVGDRGKVVWLRGRPDGAEDPPTDADLYGVEVRPDGGLHVVGATREGRGEAWRWTAHGGWSAVLTDLDGVLFKVQDGFVVGEGWWGTWDTEAQESRPDLTPWDWRGIVVQAGPAGCGWMGGRRDGAPVLATLCAGSLSVLEGPAQGVSLAGLATTPSGYLWAATGDGLALGRSAAGVWSAAPHAQARELHGVVATRDGGALFLGGDLTGGSEGVLLGSGGGQEPRSLSGCRRRQDPGAPRQPAPG